MRRDIHLENLTMFEKILSTIFKKYSYKIYKLGVIDSFNWNNVDNVNDWSTTYKISENIIKQNKI